MSKEQLNCLRNKLINHTVRIASEESEFYKQLYADINIASIKTVTDLQKLPIITKEEIQNAKLTILCKNKSCTYIQNTSGSTGEPLLIYRSQEEADFIKRFFSELIDKKKAI